MMRQPTSIYVRSAHRNAMRFIAKVERRMRKVLSRNDADRAQHPSDSRAAVDRETLRSAMNALGLGAGDTVLVHSGISHLGKVAGGPRGVFELIRQEVGERGIVLYPVFPFDSLMHTYLKSHPHFDARTAPSKMGALTRFALNSPGGLRSIHPTHSVLAFGPRSAELVNEHHLCPTPFADRSPFARLVDCGGKILLLGVGLNSTTSFHRTEDRLGERFPVKVYRSETFRVPCVDAQGASLEVSTRAHDPFISTIRDCDLVKVDFLRSGVLRELRVGDGVVGLLDAAAMDQALEQLCFDGRKTIYGKLWG